MCWMSYNPSLTGAVLKGEGRKTPGDIQLGHGLNDTEDLQLRQQHAD